MRGERGFTLFEVVVALLILAIALAALFHGASGGLQSVSVAGRYQEALARARSRLATIGHGIALAPVRQTGEDGDGFRWEIDIAPAGSATPVRQPADQDHGPAKRVALYAVQVSESWETKTGVRQVRLQTRRITILP
jgi:general secretion pathway protein I